MAVLCVEWRGSFQFLGLGDNSESHIVPTSACSLEIIEFFGQRLVTVSNFELFSKIKQDDLIFYWIGVVMCISLTV